MDACCGGWHQRKRNASVNCVYRRQRVSDEGERKKKEYLD